MSLHMLGSTHKNRFMHPSISDSVDPRRAVALYYTLHPRLYYRCRPPMTDVVHPFNNSPNRSRSLSTDDAPSPGSSSSDSHSSSDPDLHLTALSSSWSNSSPFEASKQFQTDLNSSADQRCFEFESPMSFSSFHTLHPFQSPPNYDMDDIILAPEVSSSTPSRSDMLKLEELLDDASFEYAKCFFLLFIFLCCTQRFLPNKQIVNLSLFHLHSSTRRISLITMEHSHCQRIRRLIIHLPSLWTQATELRVCWIHWRNLTPWRITLKHWF